ncbi:MAG: preprotein translocase subunit SecE [Pyrinomonadaceae bacterium]|nr:preprotein translocase subunit SecE [Pyrinomonadaceae bacterium]
MATASDTVKKKDKEKGGGIGEFLKDTRAEWDKTTFPSSDEVTNTTIIVVISVIIISIFLYLVDLTWVFLLEQLTNLVNRVIGI